MSIISLVGNKGGAGKTTLAINIAAGLARNDSTIILDADPQGSSLQWNAFTGDGAVPEVIDASEGLADILGSVRNDYTHVVVDCPPSARAEQTHDAMRYSDVAVIPVQPSPVDIWATVHIAEVIEAARGSNPALRALMVINQMEPRTTLSRLVRDALVELEMPVANSALRRRVIYKNSALEGKSVLEMGKRGAAAAEELDQLINEIISP